VTNENQPHSSSGAKKGKNKNWKTTFSKERNVRFIE
jgi:hypothetical protein